MYLSSIVKTTKRVLVKLTIKKSCLKAESFVTGGWYRARSGVIRFTLFIGYQFLEEYRCSRKDIRCLGFFQQVLAVVSPKKNPHFSVGAFLWWVVQGSNL